MPRHVFERTHPTIAIVVQKGTSMSIQEGSPEGHIVRISFLSVLFDKLLIYSTHSSSPIDMNKNPAQGIIIHLVYIYLSPFQNKPTPRRMIVTFASLPLLQDHTDSDVWF